MSGINQDRRYQQLMHLLEKSSIYTTFLLEKIKDEEETRKKEEEKIKENSIKKQQGSRSSKRKKPAVSDVLNKEVNNLVIFYFA